MIRFINKLAITFILSLSFNTIQAQNYSFTLIDDGDYDFTLSAVSEFDSGAFSPLTQSYGFTLVVPDGVTITFNSYLPLGTSGKVNLIDGASLIGLDPSMADKDLYLVTTETSGAPVAAHANGQIINLVSFTVDTMPTNGALTVLDNNSILATAIPLNSSLNSFIQADIDNNDRVNFNNEFAGLTRTASINFSSLGLDDNQLESTEVSIYPNPTSKFIYVSSSYIIDKVEIFDIPGKLVLTTEKTDQIRVDQLPVGVYIFKAYAEEGSLTKKVIIE